MSWLSIYLFIYLSIYFASLRPFLARQLSSAPHVHPFDATAFESTSDSKAHHALTVIIIVVVIIIIGLITPGCNDEPLVCLC